MTHRLAGDLAGLHLDDGERGAAFAGTPRITCDGMFFEREAARLGAGIAVLPTYLVGEGELVALSSRAIAFA